MVTDETQRRWRWLRGLALVLVVSVALAACGGDDDDDDDLSVRTDPGESSSVIDASPGANTLPQDAVVETIEITDDGIDPGTIEARVGFPVVLTVVGDGEAHTMEIGNYVNDTAIDADGETLVQFTVPEDTEGEVDILLDGESVGIFRAQAAGGLTD